MRLAEIMEVRKQPFEIDRHRWGNVVVNAGNEAIARPVIVVGAEILAVKIGDVLAVGRVDTGGHAGLQVVDAAVGSIPRSSQKEAEFFVLAPAMAKCPVEPAAPESVLQGVVSGRAIQRV